jgi:hypothetical protein
MGTSVIREVRNAERKVQNAECRMQSAECKVLSEEPRAWAVNDRQACNTWARHPTLTPLRALPEE